MRGDGREAARGGRRAWSASAFHDTDGAGARCETTPSVAFGDISPQGRRLAVAAPRSAADAALRNTPKKSQVENRGSKTRQPAKGELIQADRHLGPHRPKEWLKSPEIRPFPGLLQAQWRYRGRPISALRR
ncbi:hypothetical protein MPLB_300014 [Mesorhizobium sp. ORS 3324]|nr:hypothetical protein MPLB_300014 [Mesorhizobium sp. ORS 3324]